MKKEIISGGFNYKLNKEGLIEMRKIKFNPKIITKKIDNKHKDSLFYDGDIAQITKPNGTKLYLITAGDIRIYKNVDKGTELVFDGKERNSGFDFKLTDKTLSKRIGNSYSDKYYWDMNNWFEVTWKKKDEDFMDCDLGNVAYDYDEAIGLLKSYFEDDNY
jgi:hypothetical protein